MHRAAKRAQRAMLHDAFGMRAGRRLARRRAGCRAGSAADSRAEADDAVDAVARGQILEMYELHQLIRDRAPTCREPTGLIDRRRQRRTLARASGAMARRCVRSAPRLALRVRAVREPARSARDCLRSISARRTARSECRRVAAHCVSQSPSGGPQAPDPAATRRLLRRLVRDRQACAHVNDGRARRVARIVTDRGDVLVRHELDEDAVEALDSARRCVSAPPRRVRTLRRAAQAQSSRMPACVKTRFPAAP